MTAALERTACRRRGAGDDVPIDVVDPGLSSAVDKTAPDEGRRRALRSTAIERPR